MVCFNNRNNRLTVETMVVIALALTKVPLERVFCFFEFAVLYEVQYEVRMYYSMCRTSKKPVLACALYKTPYEDFSDVDNRAVIL